MLLTWSFESLSLVALEDVVGEEACAPEPGDFEVQCSHTGVERPQPVPVPAVAAGGAYLLRLRRPSRRSPPSRQAGRRAPGG